MNEEQAKSFVRWITAIIGPFLMAHGYVTEESLQLWGGVIVALIPLAWSLYVHTQHNAVAVVDKIAQQPDSPIKVIVTEGTIAGKEMAASLPGNTTVVAGTPSAIRSASESGSPAAQYP